MTDERAHLAQTDRHIARAKDHIRKQQQRVERLAAKGHDVDDAENFLSLLTDILRTFERHRILILDRKQS